MTGSVYWVALDSRWIYEEESNRLDASYYSEDIAKARIVIKELLEKKEKIFNMNDPILFKKIFWPGRFKRKYTSERGMPFLMPSEVIMSSPKAHKFVVDIPEDVVHENGWLLITRSGTIGRCVITDQNLGRFALSDDLIRLVPTENCPLGYVYAYLNTWIGQAFLTKTNYGMTVKHIESHHIASIPIPIISNIQTEVNEKILEASKLREKANLLEREAISVLEQKLEDLTNIKRPL